MSYLPGSNVMTDFCCLPFRQLKKTLYWCRQILRCSIISHIALERGHGLIPKHVLEFFQVTLKDLNLGT